GRKDILFHVASVPAGSYSLILSLRVFRLYFMASYSPLILLLVVYACWPGFRLPCPLLWGYVTFECIIVRHRLYAPPISHIPLNNKIVYSDYKSTGLSRYVQLQQAFYLHCNKYVKCLVDLPVWFNREKKTERL